MTNDELARQAELTGLILQNTAQINTNLRTQLGYQSNLAAGVTPSVAGAASGPGGFSAPAVGSNSAAGAAANAAVLNDTTAQVEVRLKEIKDLASDLPSDILTAIDKSGKALNQIISKDYMTSLTSIQKLYGGLSGPGGVFNATNAVSRKLVGTVDDVYKSLVTAGSQWEASFGMLPRRALGDLSTVMANFNTLLTGESGAVNGLRLVQDMNQDTVLEYAGLQRAMSLTNEEMQNFVSRQISLTGKASMDMAREAAVFSKKIAAVTGDSSKAIASAIGKIIGDTKNFGNVTVEEAARISATLREIGIGYQDLGTMLGKFQGFESAAGSVSALTTVFGVQLDAMELMTLANTDQESFLRKIRDQFIATARSVDDMTLAEKRLIAEQLGLSNIEAVERLFDPDADLTSIDALNNATTSVSQTAEDTQAAMRFLKDDIISVESVTAYSTATMRANIEEGLRQPFQKAAIGIEQDAVKIARNFETIGAALPAKAMEAFGSGISDIVNLKDADLDKLKAHMNGLGDVLTAGTEKLKSSDLGKAITGKADSAVKSLTSTNFGDSLAKGMSSAFDKILEDWKTTADEMVKIIKDFLGQSESPIGTKFRIGWITAAKSTVGEFKDVMTGRDGMIDIIDSVSKEGQATQTLMFKNNIEAAKGMLKELKIDQENMSLARREEWAKDFDLDEANAEIILGLTTKRIEAAQEGWKTALSSSSHYISKEQASLFSGVTDITSTELDEQLSTFGSTYNVMANQLGELGIEYSKLGDDQREFYAEQFKLGDGWEKELKQVFSSNAYQQGQQRKTTQDNILESMKSFKAAGVEASDLGDQYLATVKRRHGIDANTFRELYKSKDNEGATTAIQKLLEEKDMAESRRQAAEKGTRPEDSKGKGSSGISSASNTHIRNTAKSAAKNEATLVDIKAMLGKIKEAIESQDLTIESGAIKIRAQDITNAVGATLNITSGEGNGKTIQIK
jgi:hypothetical protein